MQRILIISLSVHWTIMFALAAFQVGALEAEAPAAAAALASAHALAAMLFLWMATAFWSASPGEAGTVARLAFAVAVLVLAAAALAGGLGGRPFPPGATAIQIAALGVTYLVVSVEEAGIAGERPGTGQLSGAFARRLALAAAHGSMLGRLSKRSAPPDWNA